MNWTTSCARAAVERVVRERQLLGRAEPNVDARIAGSRSLDERLRRVDGGDGIGADAGDELGRQRARPAADIDHPLPGCDPGEIGELSREQHGVASHEPVVRIGGDVEEHAGETRRADR